jgi:hypothetical protein
LIDTIHRYYRYYYDAILCYCYDVVYFIYIIFITFSFFVIKSTSNLSKMGGNQSIVYATPIT